MPLFSSSNSKKLSTTNSRSSVAALRTANRIDRPVEVTTRKTSHGFFSLECPRRGTALLWLIVVLAAVAAILSYRAIIGKFNRQLHAAVSERMREVFPKARIYIGNVAFNGTREIVANDLRMAISSESGSKKVRQVLTCERVVLKGDLDIAHWVQQSIRIAQIDLYGMQLDAWPATNGHWSLEQLKPAQPANSCTPIVAVHDALLKVHRDSSPRSATIVLHDINGRFAPASPSLVDRCSPSAVDINLSASSSGLMKRVTLAGRWDAEQVSWKAQGKIEQFDFTHELIQQLPPQAAHYLTQLAGLECRASLDYQISRSSQQSPVFELLGKLTDGRLQDARLPYPLEKLNGNFYCHNSLLQLREMTAVSGGASLKLDTDIAGFALNVPMEIHAYATNLELDHRLYASLPEKYRVYWDRLKLEGTVDAGVHLKFDGHRWLPSARIECRDVSLTPWLFPYPLTSVTGLVVFESDQIRSERLAGSAGGQTAEGSFNLQSVDGIWSGTLTCRTLGPVAVDEQLLTALTAVQSPRSPTENFVRTLHPAGVVQLTSATFERHRDESVWRKKIDASVYNGTIRYDGFRYPIHEIRGRIVGQDDAWWLDQFEGRNGSGRILCTGSWQTPKSGPTPLDLKFRAFALPMEEELQRALPEDARYLWDQLQPSGALDTVDVHITRAQTDSKVDLIVHIHEESKSNAASGRSLQLYPQEFPYWLTNVACDITYSPGRIQIASASASNGPSRVSVEGNCYRDVEKQQWVASMHWLPSTRLMIDNQFLQALPASIRQSLVNFDFRGPLSVLGLSEIVLSPSSQEGPTTSWNCQLDIEDAQLGEGNNVDAMRGTIWVQGQNDRKVVRASGKVKMDAMTVRGVPVTQLNGPFALLGSQLYFGTDISEVIPAADGNPSPAMTAEALAGSVTISGHGRLDTGKFYVKADLKGAELSAMLQDVGVNRATTQARCDAWLEFNGVPWNSQTYNGSGNIHLSDAKLYQLPFMIRLLSLTSVNGDDAAFNSADIQFTIDGDRIPLNVACEGDVLRLVGSGWTNLRREIQLELYTYVGKRMVMRNVFDPLLAESRYASAMMIEVSGTLDNLNMQRRAFPQFDSTLQQIFPKVAERRQENPVLPWRR